MLLTENVENMLNILFLKLPFRVANFDFWKAPYIKIQNGSFGPG